MGLYTPEAVVRWWVRRSRRVRRAVVRLRRGMLATLRGRRFGEGKRVWREEGMRRR